MVYLRAVITVETVASIAVYILSTSSCYFYVCCSLQLLLIISLFCYCDDCSQNADHSRSVLTDLSSVIAESDNDC